MRLLRLALAATLTLVMLPAPAAAHPGSSSSFVRRDGSTLTLAGKPFRFAGTNIYWLGLDENWFDPAIEDGNSVMRLLHYPPVPDAESGAIRAGAHEDINLITLLLGAEEAGLELLAKDGRWLPVSPPEGALAVNIGDMLQRLTNGRLRSTTHRVINPVGERARHSRFLGGSTGRRQQHTKLAARQSLERLDALARHFHMRLGFTESLARRIERDRRLVEQRGEVGERRRCHRQ